MRRAWSVSRLARHEEQAGRRAGHVHSAALPTSAARRSADGLRKDPSLAALLLGEVAEVC
jgi:hypothetical protein